MARVSVAVMACEARRPYVEELLERLDHPATVAWEDGNGRYDTGRRALLSYDRNATAHLVIQDDAVVCRDLVASVTKAVGVIRTHPLSLFYSKGTNAAHQRTSRLANSVKRPTLLRFAGPWWGVAVVFPTRLIPEMIRIADEPRPSPAYDRRLSGALNRMGVDCFYVLPSLVDHRLDGPSMIEGRAQDGRSAHHFIGAEASALDIDWRSLPTVDGYPVVRGRRPVVRRPSPPRRRRTVQR